MGVNAESTHRASPDVSSAAPCGRSGSAAASSCHRSDRPQRRPLHRSRAPLPRVRRWRRSSPPPRCRSIPWRSRPTPRRRVAREPHPPARSSSPSTAARTTSFSLQLRLLCAFRAASPVSASPASEALCVVMASHCWTPPDAGHRSSPAAGNTSPESMRIKPALCMTQPESFVRRAALTTDQQPHKNSTPHRPASASASAPARRTAPQAATCCCARRQPARPVQASAVPVRYPIAPEFWRTPPPPPTVDRYRPDRAICQPARPPTIQQPPPPLRRLGQPSSSAPVPRSSTVKPRAICNTFRFARIAVSAASARSANHTCSAPRLIASIPTAPVPA